MGEDINKVMIVGRLTRDSELSYTNSGYALCKFSIAVNRRKKEGGQWIDEANYFDCNLWGKRGESIKNYLLKGTQVGIDGQLKQERWTKDGQTRSKVSIDVGNVQLLGSKQNAQQPNNQQNWQQQGQGGHNANGALNHPMQGQDFNTYKPPTAPTKGDYEDQIPF